MDKKYNIKKQKVLWPLNEYCGNNVKRSELHNSQEINKNTRTAISGERIKFEINEDKNFPGTPGTKIRIGYNP